MHGNSVFFDVLSNRTVTGWRVNDIRDQCNGGYYTYGAFDLGTNTIPIDVQGNFAFQATFQTTLTSGDNGDTIPATEHFQVAGHIQGSIASGTVLDTFEFDYNGSHYSCSNNAEGWTANRLP